MKTCSKCGTEKPLGEFSPRHDGKWGGYYPACKQCRRDATRSYREADKPGTHAKARAYARTLYRRSASAFKERVARWKQENPARRAAQLRLKKAVSLGRILKPVACSRCGDANRRIEAHHEDYRRPLDVAWLCKPCHVKADRERRKREVAA
jgi:hypothetical protein